MKILLVEDDELIGQAVVQGLREAHFQVDWATDGASGLEEAQDKGYGLLILDVMLPQMDGWSIVRTLRGRRDTTPILMLTARDSVEDRVKGLEMGADDYLPKPFDFTELMARVRALMRRNAVNKGRVIKVGDMTIDTKERQVTRGGDQIALTPREYSLLEALATRAGQVLTRDVILEHVWMNEESLPNTVDVYIGLLRRKIDAGRDTKLIRTVHGLGYSLRGGIPDAVPVEGAV